MLCKNCGNTLSSLDKFCPKCGTPVELETPEEISEKVEGSATAEVVESTASDETAVPVESVKGSWLKMLKFDKKFIMPAALTALILVVVISTFAYVRNAVMQLFLSSDKYLSYVVTSNVDDFADTMAKSIEISKDFYLKGISGTGEVEIKKGDAIGDLIYDFTGEDVDEYIDWLDSAGISADIKGKDGVYEYDMGVNVNGVDFGKFDLVFDMDDMKMYMGAPDYNSTYAEIDIEELYGEGMYYSPYGYYEELQKLLEAFPKEAALRKMINRYVKAVANGFEDVEESKDTISTGGISQKVTKLSFTVDGELLRKICLNVMKEAKKDKELKKFVEDFTSAVGEEIDVDDAWDTIDEGIEYFEEMDGEVISEDIADVEVFVNTKGEIVGFEIEADEFTVKSYTVQKGNKFASIFEVEAEGVTIALKGDGKISGNKQTGTFELGVSAYGFDVDVLEIDVEKLNIKKIKQGLLDGTITIRFADGFDDMLGMAAGYGYDSYDMELLEALTKFEISVKSSQKSFKDENVTIIFKYDGETALEITSKAKLGNAKKAKIPSKTVDVADDYGAEEWLEDFDLNGLIKKLEKAEFPDEIVEELEYELEY